MLRQINKVTRADPRMGKQRGAGDCQLVFKGRVLDADDEQQTLAALGIRQAGRIMLLDNEQIEYRQQKINKKQARAEQAEQDK